MNAALDDRRLHRVETDVATVQLLLNQRHRMTLDILRFDMFQFDFHDLLLLPGRARAFR